MKILGTGLSGMVGSCITDTLRDKYEFEDISFDSGVDVRNYDQVFKRMSTSSAETILHLAAKTDVDACEKDKTDDWQLLKKKGVTDILKLSKQDLNDLINWNDWKESNAAFAVNVVGTLNIAHACYKLQKKLIYISTDFVFDGREKKVYSEDDEPNPVNYYSETKWWGEHIVHTLLDNYLVVRFAYPYGTHHPIKKDFVRIIRERLEKGEEVLGVTDQIITPSFVPDIAAALDHLITHTVTKQTFHLVGSDSFSPYDIAVAIGKQFGYDTEIIKKTTAAEYYTNRAPRPQFLSVSNEKISKRGVLMKTFTEGLKEIKS